MHVLQVAMNRNNLATKEQNFSCDVKLLTTTASNFSF